MTRIIESLGASDTPSNILPQNQLKNQYAVPSNNVSELPAPLKELHNDNKIEILSSSTKFEIVSPISTDPVRSVKGSISSSFYPSSEQSTIELSNSTKRDSIVSKANSCNSSGDSILVEQELKESDSKYQVAIVAALRAMASTAPDEMPNFISAAKFESADLHTNVTAFCWSRGEEKRLKMKLYYRSKFLKIYEPEDYIDMASSFNSEFTKTGAGKSGSSMYWSKNKKYIAKTLSSIEVAKSKPIFEELIEYHAFQRNSYLVKYCALIRINFKNSSPVYFSIMPNILHGFEADQIYDLKGSTHGRISRPNEKILKDLDFSKQAQSLIFSSELDRKNWLDQFSRDIFYLNYCRRIDYSLLVAYNSNTNTWKAGIIDVLTPYSKRKTIEYLVMGSLYGFGDISCSPPTKYSARLLDFVYKICRSE